MTNTTDKFYFKEIDDEGLETLQAIADAKRFNEWMFSSFSKFCSGKILEIGSGIGNISEILVNYNHDITLSDIRENYRAFLSSKFPQLSQSGKIVELDLVHPEFTLKYESFLNSFDTVFALNVIEHIESDSRAIENCKLLLRPGGNLIILVPAFNQLYNQLDKELYHYRRYNKKSLESLFRKCDIPILKSYYFNAAGIPGWFISGKLQKNKTIPKGQMGFFNMLVPVFRLTDKLLFNKIGLSVVCIGKK